MFSAELSVLYYICRGIFSGVKSTIKLLMTSNRKIIIFSKVQMGPNCNLHCWIQWRSQKFVFVFYLVHNSFGLGVQMPHCPPPLAPPRVGLSSKNQIIKSDRFFRISI